MKISKRLVSLFLTLLTLCSLCSMVAIPTFAASTTPYDALSSSRYAKVFTLATSGRQTVYTTPDLKTPGNKERGPSNAWICAVDELWLMDVGVTNGQYWAFISYPGSGGRRTGYIPLSAITANTHAVKSTSTGKFYCSPRLGKSASSNYYVAKSDVVWLVAVNGSSQVQLLYPTSSGFRIAWAAKSDYEKYCGKIGSGSGQLIPNGDYVIVSGLNGNKVVDVNGASNDNCANVQLWTRNGSGAQTFRLTYNAGGWYTIVNVQSGKALDVTNGEAKCGQNVWQYQCNGTNAQKWYLEDAGGGYYYIRSALGYYLDVNGGCTTDGTNIQIWTGNKSNAQKFKFEAFSSMDATQRSVQSRLDEIANGTRSYNDSTVMKVGSKFTGFRSGEQCKGYAKNVFYICFKIQPGSTQGNKYLLNSTTGMTEVGRVTNQDAQSLANLFVKARPGDFLQMRRSHGGPHSAIIYSVSATGVTFLEANTDSKNTVMLNTYSWADLAAKNNAMTLYTATTYALK